MPGFSCKATATHSTRKIGPRRLFVAAEGRPSSRSYSIARSTCRNLVRLSDGPTAGRRSGASFFSHLSDLSSLVIHQQRRRFSSLRVSPHVPTVEHSNWEILTSMLDLHRDGGENFLLCRTLHAKDCIRCKPSAGGHLCM